MGDDDSMQTLTLPVSFDSVGQLVVDDTLDLNNANLEEVDGTDIGELWNSDIESIFLPKTGSLVNTKKKSSASASRILTSPEIIQARKEKGRN